MSYRDAIVAYRGGLTKVLEDLDASQVERFIHVLSDALREGRQVFLFGNGGSGATASHMAIHAPVTPAVRVPPSAWRTSTSIQMVRRPSAGRSVTARSARPRIRWISISRPSGRPRVEARRFRPGVQEGSIPYSAVTQPLPFPSRNSGTFSSTVAVQRTRVFPHS